MLSREPRRPLGPRRRRADEVGAVQEHRARRGPMSSGGCGRLRRGVGATAQAQWACSASSRVRAHRRLARRSCSRSRAAGGRRARRPALAASPATLEHARGRPSLDAELHVPSTRSSARAVELARSSQHRATSLRLRKIAPKRNGTTGASAAARAGARPRGRARSARASPVVEVRAATASPNSSSGTARTSAASPSSRDGRQLEPLRAARASSSVLGRRRRRTSAVLAAPRSHASLSSLSPSGARLSRSSASRPSSRCSLPLRSAP